MCGITYQPINTYVSNTINYRGPDNTQNLETKRGIFSFHRLSINDSSILGNQPFSFNHITYVCNGEIYNWEELKQEYAIDNYKSNSDCEIIGHLYNLVDIEILCQKLDGVFAFVMETQDSIIAARDPIGIRPLFVSEKNNAFSSEAKELLDLGYTDVIPFPPNTYFKNGVFIEYRGIIYDCPSLVYNENTLVDLLTKAVKKRLMSDNPVACLLSGGLDSSIIAALAQKCSNYNINTFSIGMFKDAPDLCYARTVAQYIGSTHHEIIYSEEEGLEALNEVIYHLESYDCTTVRASIPMFLLSKYISQNTDFKVILSGEGADELFGGYIYFHNAPNYETFQEETVRLVKDVYKYDVLRGDRATAGNGLEIRVPFFDKTFAQYILNIDPKLKHPNGGIEKHILRKAFSEELPTSVIFRQKDAFSDAVGYSWKNCLKSFAEKNLSTAMLDECHKFGVSTISDEEAYYKQVYYKYFKEWNQLDYMWRPKWTDILDPSATFLKLHNTQTISTFRQCPNVSQPRL